MISSQKEKFTCHTTRMQRCVMKIEILSVALKNRLCGHCHPFLRITAADAPELVDMLCYIEIASATIFNIRS